MMDYSYLNQTFDSGAIDHAQLNQQIGASYPELSNSVNYNLNQFKSYYLNNQNHGSIGTNQNSPTTNVLLSNSNNSVVNTGSLGQTSVTNQLNATSPLLNGNNNSSTLQTNRTMQSEWF